MIALSGIGKLALPDLGIGERRVALLKGRIGLHDRPRLLFRFLKISGVS